MKQFLNNIRTGGHSSQSSRFSQGSGQLSVFLLQIPDRVLHGGQKRGFRKPRGGLCLPLPDPAALHLQPASLLQRRELLLPKLLILFCFLRLFLIGRPPSLFQQSFPPGQKPFSSRLCCKAALLIDAGRQQNCQKTADNQIIYFSLLRAHGCQLYVLFCGNNGVMVRYFRIIHKGKFSRKILFSRPGCQSSVGACLDRSQPLLQGRHKIRTQIAGIRPRIGKNLVVFIETLHEIQRFLCGKTVLSAGIPLKLRQIIKGRRRLPPFLFVRPGDSQRALSGLFLYLFSSFSGKSAEASALLLLPGKLDSLRRQGNAVIGLRLKAPDFFLSPRNHGQRWRLHSSAGELRIILAGQRPSGIDAHQPVRLRPGDGRFVEMLVLPGIFQMRKTIPDGFVSHRRNPQTLQRLSASRFLQNPPGHQFSLSARVRSDHHFPHILAVQKTFHLTVLSARLGNDFYLQLLRHDGKHLQLPFFIFFIVILGILQGNQMTQRPGYDILLSLHESVSHRAAGKHPADITAYGGLLGNYKRFHNLFPLFLNETCLFQQNWLQ